MTSNLWLTDRTNNLAPSATIAFGDRIHQLTQSGHEITNLLSGTPEFDTPAGIKDAAGAALEKDYRYMTYTDSAGLLELREAIAVKLEHENTVRAASKDLRVTVGVKEGIALATQACLSAGDEVLLPMPAWVTYEPLIKIVGATPVGIDNPSGPKMPPQADELARKITPRTRAILLNTPHNPTGHVYRRHELEAIANMAQRHDLLVMVDETLEYLIYDSIPHVSIAALPGMKERTITFNGFSKAYCMAGWRVGYCTGPSDVIAGMLKVHQHLVTCANAVAQKGAVEALLGPQSERRSIREKLRSRRDIAVTALNKLSGVECPAPEAGLFCFPNVSGTRMTDQEFADCCLEHAKVACLAGSDFGAGNHVRVAFGRRSTEELQAAIERMGSMLDDRSKPLKQAIALG